MADSKHYLLSGRFDGKEQERLMRRVYAELKTTFPAIKFCIVEAGPGGEFAEQTMQGLFNMKGMVSFAFENYGEKTKSEYSTFHEAKYAKENHIMILPLKFCKDWPPCPPLDFDGKNAGQALCAFIFGPSVVRQDFYGKEDISAIARCIADWALGMDGMAPHPPPATPATAEAVPKSKAEMLASELLEKANCKTDYTAALAELFKDEDVESFEDIIALWSDKTGQEKVTNLLNTKTNVKTRTAVVAFLAACVTKAAAASAASKVVCKMVPKSQCREAGNDMGCGSFLDLSYFEYKDDGWCMLGHMDSRCTEMLVVEEGPLVRLSTGWIRVWWDKGSKNKNDYDAYLPKCDDPNFVPLGVTCWFNNKDHTEPSHRVAMVHKDAVIPGDLSQWIVWEDKGTGAHADLMLGRIHETGLMWPKVASMLSGGIPRAMRIKKEMMA